MKPSPRIRLALTLGTAGFSLVSAVRDLRTARVNGDKLAVVDGVASTIAVITGLLLAWRTLRNPDEDVA